MIASWLLYATLFGTLTYGVAALVDALLRMAGRPGRYVWLAAIGVSIAVPVSVPRMTRETPPQVRLSSLTALTTASQREAESRWSLPAQATRWDTPLATAWIATTLVLLGTTLWGTLSIARRRSAWRKARIGGRDVLLTDGVGPAVVPLPGVSLLLPEWSLDLESNELDLILRHEEEHQRAGDHWTLLAAAIATALIPWSPAVWQMRRRLRLSVEMDCDARVLRSNTQVEVYGSLLLAMAVRPLTAAPMAAMLTERVSDLERRIDAMTERRQRRLPVILSLGAAAVVLVVAACEMPAPDAITGAQAVDAETPFLEFQVEQAASIASSSAPRYPALLRSANIEGEVVARFVVDTNGAAEPGTVRITRSTHELFSIAVRSAIPSMRFNPARVGGHPVRSLVTVPFVFSLSKNEAARTTRGPTIR